MSKNTIVKSIRPLETHLEDFEDYAIDQNYRIAFAAEPDGKHTAKTEVNGHQFSATHPDRNKASLKLQQKVDAAIENGDVAHPAGYLPVVKG